MPWFWNSRNIETKASLILQGFWVDGRQTRGGKLPCEFSSGLTVARLYRLHLGSILLSHPVEASIVIAAAEFLY